MLITPRRDCRFESYPRSQLSKAQQFCWAFFIGETICHIGYTYFKTKITENFTKDKPQTWKNDLNAIAENTKDFSNSEGGLHPELFD
jgi:hypothetical protein